MPQTQQALPHAGAEPDSRVKGTTSPLPPEGQGPRLAAQTPPLWAPEALLPPGTNMGAHGHAVQPESLLSEPSRNTTPSFQNSPRTKLILPLLGHISEKSFYKASVTVMKREKVTPVRGSAPTGGDTPGPLVTGWSLRPSVQASLSPPPAHGPTKDRPQAHPPGAVQHLCMGQEPHGPGGGEQGGGSREEGRRPETHPHQHLLLGPTRPAVSCIK